MDALTHAVEAYIGNSTTYGTRKDAILAVKLIFENIYTAYEDGRNVEARRNMLRASFYAGCAFTKSYVGYVHAVAHSLGGEYNVPHGLANAVILPMVLKAYGEVIHPKLARLAVAAGLTDPNTPCDEAAKCFISAIQEMKKTLWYRQSYSGNPGDRRPETGPLCRQGSQPALSRSCADECSRTGNLLLYADAKSRESQKRF